MPPPVPPSVNAGRMMTGKRPIFSVTARASSRLCAVPLIGHVEADGNHEVLEDLPVFAAFDGLGFGANHLDAVFLQHAALVQSHRRVERGLAAERREQNELVR